jgi:hypothetical protein
MSYTNSFKFSSGRLPCLLSQSFLSPFLGYHFKCGKSAENDGAWWHRDRRHCKFTITDGMMQRVDRITRTIDCLIRIDPLICGYMHRRFPQKKGLNNVSVEANEVHASTSSTIATAE